MAIDFEADADRGANPQALTELVAKARELRELEERAAKLKEELDGLNKDIITIQTKTLPDMMASAGVSSFNLADGSSIVIKKVLTGSIPSQTAINDADEAERPILEERRNGCFQWLRLNGHGDLIKNALSVEFPRGKDEEAEKLKAFLIKKGFTPHLETAVNHQTLNKFIREVTADEKLSRNFPTDLFKVFEGKKAEITLPKPEGKRKK